MRKRNYDISKHEKKNMLYFLVLVTSSVISLRTSYIIQFINMPDLHYTLEMH